MYNLKIYRLIWVTGTRMGKKFMKCHFFFKVRSWYARTAQSKNWHNLEFFYLILAGKIVPNKISCIRRNLGCAPYPQSWVLFQKFKNTVFLLLYYSACKTATAMVFRF